MKISTLLVCILTFASLTVQAQNVFESSLQQWSAQTLDEAHQTSLRQAIENYDTVASSVKIQVNTHTKTLTVVGDPTRHSVEHLIAIGTQVGLYAPISFEAIDVMRKNGAPWIDASLRVQPSAYQQAIHVSGDYHLLRSRFFVGAHGNLTFLRAPWDPYYDQKLDHVYGMGVQGGIRGFMGKKQRFLGTLEVGSTWTISRVYDRPMTFHVGVGIAYRIFRK